MPRLCLRLLTLVVCGAIAACQTTPRETTSLRQSGAAEAQAASRPQAPAAIATMPAGRQAAELGGPFTGADAAAYRQAGGAALNTGQPTAWEGPSGAFGRIVATSTPYRQAGRTCRDFAQTYSHTGRVVSDRGTACQGADGIWTRAS